MEKPHKKLDVWNVSMALVSDIYEITKCFPPEEKFGLIDQLRRASVSIPSNIAEGSARNTRKEFVNYLHVAQGSVSEVDTQLEIAQRLGFITTASCKEIETKLERISKMITGLIRNQKDLS